MDNMDVLKYYEEDYNEDDRLTYNPLEFIRSKQIISRYLKKESMTIADIAGGTGRYSHWLAREGHHVHLLDLSRKHIEQAKSHSKEFGMDLSSYTCGDARRLPYVDDQFDMVLLMGALYHLQDYNDRDLCLCEAFRVLKPGGILICSYISRYASLLDGYRSNMLADPKFIKILECDLQTGKHENQGKKEYFTTAFFHTPDLIVEELTINNFQDISLYSVEGFASLLNVEDLFKDKRLTELLLKHFTMTENKPELLGVSSHILSICVKSPG